MEILGWLLIPLAATILGLLWMAWHGRDRKPVDAEQGMEGMARFREAMAKPLPPLQRDPQGDGGGSATGTDSTTEQGGTAS